MRKKIKKKIALFNVGETARRIAHTLETDLSYESQIDPAATRYNYEAQKKAAFKKYLEPRGRGRDGGVSVQDMSAYKKFFIICDHLAEIDASFLPPLPGPKHDFQSFGDVDSVLIMARSLCRQILDDFSLDALFQYCKHGPGATVGTFYGHTHLTGKMALPLTATMSQARIFNLYLKWDPLLLEMIQRENPDVVLTTDDFSIYDLVSTSSATCVLKNDEISRMICKETTVGMFLQQGLGVWMCERLVLFGIDIEKQQDIHRMLAMIFSITGLGATLDWQSASDCSGLNFCSWLLPPKIVAVMMQLRCEAIEFPALDGLVRRIPMVSTMGNAFTFPLETLVFFSIAIAVRSRKLVKGRSSLPEWEAFNYDITVFGDDCIVPSDDVPLFSEVLEKVGFILNKDKSYWMREERFRESCGGDYFRGRNVRPYYFRHPGSTKPSRLRAWLYVMWNRILLKLISSFGPLTYAYLPTVALLAKLISDSNPNGFYVVPSYYPDDAGCKLFGDASRLLRLFKKETWPSIVMDVHGTAYFEFLCAQTFDDEEKNESYYYWSNRKSPHKPEFSLELGRFESSIAANGLGYVVRSSTDCGSFGAELTNSKGKFYKVLTTEQERSKERKFLETMTRNLSNF